MNILIADKLSETAVKNLEEEGFKVKMMPDLGADDLPQEIEPYDILIVRSTKVNAKTIQNGKNLSLIIRAGAGVNTIDIEEASRLGIHVTNCPGKNTAAVAELAMGLIISADRRIADCTEDIRNGKWNKKLYSKAAGLKGKTLGIIGVGAIGKALANGAKAFGINIIAWSRSLTEEKAEELGIGFCKTPIDVAKNSDIISVHLAANNDTKKMINKDFFSKMKDGAIFINTSRGEIVDTNALKDAINTKNVKAALDVYENEPGSSSTEFEDVVLAKMITGTHHIGASTEQAAEAIAAEAVRIVKVFVENGQPPNVVNLRTKSETNINLVVRHFNKVGVLAGILDEIRSAGINIEEMQNSVFNGGKAAVCTIKLDAKPEKDLIAKILENSDIINVSLK